MQVDARNLEAGFARGRRRSERVGGREAELGAVVGGPDLLVGVRVDSRRDPHERSPHAGRRRPLRLVERVEHDEAHVRLRGGPQLLVALVVAVHDDPLAGDTCPAGELELPERRDVGAEALGREQPQQLDVRERLQAVERERIRGRLAVGARGVQDRLLAVDDERRAELGGEVRGADAADAQLAAFDGGGLGEERKHALDRSQRPEERPGQLEREARQPPPRVGERVAQRLGRALVHARAVPAEDVLRVEARELPRRRQAQERVDAEPLAAQREVVRRRFRARRP